MGDIRTHRDVQEVRRVDERQLMVTHWHLVGPQVWDISDRDRHDTDRMQEERRKPDAVAHSPGEAVAWLERTLDRLITEHELTAEQLYSSGLATAEQRKARLEVRQQLAELGRDICALLAIRGGRIVHYSAYAEPDCTQVH